MNKNLKKNCALRFHGKSYQKVQKNFFDFLKFWVFSEARSSTPNHAILT